jgi:hypothetical protein
MSHVNAALTPRHRLAVGSSRRRRRLADQRGRGPLPGVLLRMRQREGPVQLAARLGIAPSTVHRILRSARLNRLPHVDRATGEPIRRYEHPYPGFADRGVTVERVLQTMAAPTGLTGGETPAKNSPSSRSGPARTVRRPTARSSASTAPWPTGGPMPAAIGQNPSAGMHWRHGGITTTTTDPPPPAAVSRPSSD